MCVYTTDEEEQKKEKEEVAQALQIGTSRDLYIILLVVVDNQPSV